MQLSNDRPGCGAIWAGLTAGFITVWPVLLAGSWLQSHIQLPYRSLESALLYAALPEELIKGLAIFLVFRFLNSPPFWVGLGFGFSETVFMLTSGIWASRLLSSIPLHTGTAAITGCGILFVLTLNKPSFWNFFSRIIAAVLLLCSSILIHWIYNIAARNHSWMHYAFAWLAIIIGFSLWRIIYKRMTYTP